MFSIKWNNDNIEAACHLSLWGLFFQGRFLYMKSSIPVFPGLCDWSICSVPKGEIGDIKFSQLRTRQSIPLKSQKIKILQNDIQFTFFVHVKTSLMNILQQKKPHAVLIILYPSYTLTQVKIVEGFFWEHLDFVHYILLTETCWPIKYVLLH